MPSISIDRNLAVDIAAYLVTSPGASPQRIARQVRQSLEDADSATAEITPAQAAQDGFREGMSAGLNFAYRVVSDLNERTQATTDARDAFATVLGALVSEHDMRSDQPISEIRRERSEAQASGAALSGLREALTEANRRVPQNCGDSTCEDPICQESRSATVARGAFPVVYASTTGQSAPNFDVWLREVDSYTVLAASIDIEEDS